jgi:hypothetical protein
MTLRNVTDEQMLRAIDDLGRNLASSVPDLPDPLDTQALPLSTPQQETTSTLVEAASEPSRASGPQYYECYECQQRFLPSSSRRLSLA